MQDQVTLINEHDQVIGAMDKLEAHRGDGKLHRASSVFLFRKVAGGELQLLLQQRSDKKIVGAGQWANTVCGNVWPDENYQECASRRLSFELGITDQIELSRVAVFRYQARCNEEFSENELVHVFAGWFDGTVSPNPDEVAATRWIRWRSPELEELEAAPWFQLFLKEPAVVTGIDTYVTR